MDKITELLHLNVDINDANSIVTPIFQASAFQADSPYFYTRKNNPNIEEFEKAIAILEDIEFSIATTTGMSAISIILSLLKIKDTLVVNKDIYGCSYKIFQKIASKLDLNLIYLDLSNESNIKKIPHNTSMVFFETPTNPFLKTISIKKVSTFTKRNNPNCLTVVDNTWATPLFQKPIRLGADISLHSATKYFSGHSDVMGGVVLTSNQNLYKQLLETRFYNGCILEPFSAWLLRRSLQTLSIRMNRHSEITREMKLFLEKLPYVDKVYYPSIDGVQLTDYGTLIFFDLREDLIEKYKIFTDNLKLFDTGTGMACVTSMVAQPYHGSHASMTEDEKFDVGLSKRLIRLSFGLETPNDLKRDLLEGFKSMEKK